MAQLNHLIDMIEKNVPAVPTIDEVFSGLEAVFEADSKIRN